MISYKRCSQKDIDLMFEAFKIGFSDYMIKFDFTKERFMYHFFDIEGNQFENSFLALDDHQPVGLILGGISLFDGVKTLRCGALCMSPSYRKQGIASNLLSMHKELARKNSCDQLFLEVIGGNTKAINFYEKHGYQNRYDIFYYSTSDLSYLNHEVSSKYLVSKVDLETLNVLYEETKNIHVNYQNALDYIKKIPELIHLGIKIENMLVGGLTLSKHGKIFYLYVKEEYRLKGIASALISYAKTLLNLNKLSISYSNNLQIEEFIKHLGFNKDLIYQHEMYLGNTHD